MRRALAQAGWALVTAGSLGIAAPALGQPLGLPSGGPPPPSAAASKVAKKSPARPDEMKVTLAWLADPGTFPYQVEAVVDGTALEVRGSVPTQAVREQYLRMARENTRLTVVDALKVHPSLVPPTGDKMPATKLRQSASVALVGALGSKARGLEVTAHDDGQVVLRGSVQTDDEKLTACKSMQRVRACTRVVGELTVTGGGATEAAEAVTDLPAPRVVAERTGFWKRASKRLRGEPAAEVIPARASTWIPSPVFGDARPADEARPASEVRPVAEAQPVVPSAPPAEPRPVVSSAPPAEPRPTVQPRVAKPVTSPYAAAPSSAPAAPPVTVSAPMKDAARLSSPYAGRPVAPQGQPVVAAPRTEMEPTAPPRVIAASTPIPAGRVGRPAASAAGLGSAYVTSGTITFDAPAARAEATAEHRETVPDPKAPVVLRAAPGRPVVVNIEPAPAKVPAGDIKPAAAKSSEPVTASAPVVPAPEVRPAAPAAPTPAVAALKKCLETACGAAASNVAVVLQSANRLEITLRVHSADEGKQLAAKLLKLPELAPYGVTLKMDVEP